MNPVEGGVHDDEAGTSQHFFVVVLLLSPNFEDTIETSEVESFNYLILLF